MTRLDYKAIGWENAIYTKGGETHFALIGYDRLDKSTLPKGLYAYEVRDDDSNGKPCEIAKNIMVNFFATLITDKPIKGVEDNGYVYTSEGEFGW